MLIARHAVSEANVSGRLAVESRTARLTDLGIEQAGIMAERIRIEHPNVRAVASSSFVRAAQTAEIVSRILRIGSGNVFSDGRLDEWSFPQTFLEEGGAPKFFVRLARQEEGLVLPEGAESAETVFERMRSGITEIFQNHGDGVLIVSHRLSLENFLRKAGLPPKKFGYAQYDILEWHRWLTNEIPSS